MQRSFAVGDYVFGVRSNLPAIGEWLEVLATYEIPVEEADPYYSIWIGEDRGAVRGFHILYREGQACLRTFDLAALAQLFFSELETLMLPGDDSALHIRLGVIGRSGRSLLVPYMLVPFLRDRGSRADRDFELPLEAYISIDLETHTILPPRRRLQLPDDAVDWLVTLDPERVGTQVAPPYRPVPDLTFGWSEEDAAVARETPAKVTYALLQAALNLGRVGVPGVAAIARLVEQTETYALAPAAAKELTPVLRDLLDGHAPRGVNAGP